MSKNTIHLKPSKVAMGGALCVLPGAVERAFQKRKKYERGNTKEPGEPQKQRAALQELAFPSLWLFYGCDYFCTL